MLLENLVKQLFDSSSYFKITYPHLKEEYFSDLTTKTIIDKIIVYHNKYDKQPTIPDIKLLIESDTNINETISENCYNFLNEIKNVEPISDEQFLIDETEEWCQQRALENAIISSVDIIQKDPKNKGQIKDKIESALDIHFNIKVGNDFFKDAVNRFDFYSMEENKYPTSIDVMNKALAGGYVKKALYVWIGKTNVGKSLWATSMATDFLKQGLNVLYISAEMAEERIMQRIDANILDFDINEIGKKIDKKTYLSKVKQVFEHTKGKLIVKEYPTSAASMSHVKALLNELKSKKGFKPDIVFFDYLNIFASSRLKADASLNSYQYIKAVAEEIRGLCVQHDFVGVTFTQTNRAGSKETTGVGLDNTSESFGVPMSADFMGAIIQDEILFEQNKYLLKVLKSRFGDNINQTYSLGVCRPKMRLLNLEEHEMEMPIHMKDKLKVEASKFKSANEEENNVFDFSN